MENSTKCDLPDTWADSSLDRILIDCLRYLVEDVGVLFRK